MKPFRRILSAAAPLLLTIGVTGAVIAPADANGFPSELQGRAQASVMEVSFATPGFLIVEQPIDTVGGPISGASIEGGQSSKSFASFPYPGDPVVGFGSLAAAVTGMSPPFGYPAYVGAEYPARPKDELRPAGGPGYGLEATAAAGGAASQAALGGGGAAKEPAMQTRTVIGSSGDGIVKADASVQLRGLSLGNGALTVSMNSEAVTEYVTSKKQMVSRSLVQGELLTNSGLSVNIGPEGVRVNGQKVGDSDEAEKALSSALAPAGLSVSLFPTGTGTNGGSQSGSSSVSRGMVEIRQVLDGATFGAPKGILTIRLGMVSTSLYDPTVATGFGTEQALRPSTADRPALRPQLSAVAGGAFLERSLPAPARELAGEMSKGEGLEQERGTEASPDK